MTIFGSSTITVAAKMIIISYSLIVFPVITIMGLTTNVSENNSSVQACVNVTQGSVESRDNSVYAYISTSASTGSNSAIGKTTIEFEPCREGILYILTHVCMNSQMKTRAQ